VAGGGHPVSDSAGGLQMLGKAWRPEGLEGGGRCRPGVEALWRAFYLPLLTRFRAAKALPASAGPGLLAAPADLGVAGVSSLHRGLSQVLGAPKDGRTAWSKAMAAGLWPVPADLALGGSPAPAVGWWPDLLDGVFEVAPGVAAAESKLRSNGTCRPQPKNQPPPTAASARPCSIVLAACLEAHVNLERCWLCPDAKPILPPEWPAARFAPCWPMTPYPGRITWPDGRPTLGNPAALTGWQRGGCRSVDPHRLSGGDQLRGLCRNRGQWACGNAACISKRPPARSGCPGGVSRQRSYW